MKVVKRGSICGLFAALTIVSSVAGANVKNNLTTNSVTATQKVFTQDDIKALGVDELSQLLAYVPGFAVNDGVDLIKRKQIQARGTYNANGEILIIKDGIKLFEPTLGKLDVYMPTINLDNIDQVIIHRSVDGSRFGRGAVGGVVELISNKQNRVNVKVAEKNEQQLTASVTSELYSGELAINLSTATGDGEPVNEQDYVSTYDWRVSALSQQHTDSEVMFNWQNDNWQLAYHQDTHRRRQSWVLNGFHPRNSYKSNNQYLSGSYNKQLDAASTILVKSSYQQHELEAVGLAQSGFEAPFSFDLLFGPSWNNESTQFELLYQHQQQNLKLQFGLDWTDSRVTEAGVQTTHYNDENLQIAPVDRDFLGSIKSVPNYGAWSAMKVNQQLVSVYMLADYQLGNNALFEFGGRYDEYDDFSRQFMPSFALTRFVSNNAHFTLSYNETYQPAAWYGQLSSDLSLYGADVIKGAELDSVKVKSTQFEYTVQHQFGAVELVGLYQQKDNVTKLSKQTDDTLLLSTVDVDPLIGVELQLQGKAVDKFNFRHHVTINWTHYFSGAEQGASEYFGSMTYVGKLKDVTIGAGYRFQPDFSISDINYQSFGAIYSQSERRIWDVNVKYDLGRSIDIAFKIQNVSDKRKNSFQPHQFHNNFELVHSGRTSSLTIGYEF